MAGSRRRLKKTRTVVSMKKRNKLRTVARVPNEISAGRLSIPQKLGAEANWDQEKTLISNYQRNGFLADPNAGFGRNKRPAGTLEVAVLEEGADAAESDDDLRTVEGKQRRSGKAPLTKLTTHQRQVMQRLTDAHGDDVEAMVRDTKLNSMLLPASKLHKLLASYKVFGDRGRCPFRVPNKRLW
ncbi:hypothetical protein WJX81_003338 [Elliptochloris bilobata]|uniref:Nucleolar protein 16 n=1 Tax=Elliptochloris bilobata TaxID=381761 RepID=A0AAW1QYG9_9CHLO